MRVLRLSASGTDVLAWKKFLIGEGLLSDSDGDAFDQATRLATIAFQRRESLAADGVVGPRTWAEALREGLSLVEDDDESERGPNWPPKPPFPPLAGNAARNAVYGGFNYRHKPVPGNHENIEVLGGWAAKNLRRVVIPQLAGVRGSPPGGALMLHTACADSAVLLFQAWADAGYIHLLKTFDGAYAPRFIRGSTVTLSNHSFGTAMDLNYRWNMLGKVPALAGTEGSVRELVPIANSLGWYWGGHFTNPDGMHFEFVPS
jgi:hypothetical protein